MSGAFVDLLTLALGVGVVATCGTVMVMIATARDRRPSGRRPPRRRPVQPQPAAPPRLTSREAMLATARARATETARREAPFIETTATARGAAPAPAALAPAGRDAARPHRPAGTPQSVEEEVRRAVDHLVEHNPDYLAEVITRWIHTERTPSPGEEAREVRRQRQQRRRLK